jgi:hypothetical protein
MSVSRGRTYVAHSASEMADELAVIKKENEELQKKYVGAY